MPVANRVIVHPSDIAVEPHHIMTDDPIRNAEGMSHKATELLLQRIVQFMQQYGSWRRFTPEDIASKFPDVTANEEGWDLLRGPPIEAPQAYWPSNGKNIVPSDCYLAIDDGGNHYVTDALVLSCYKSTPCS